MSTDKSTLISAFSKSDIEAMRDALTEAGLPNTDVPDKEIPLFYGRAYYEGQVNVASMPLVRYSTLRLLVQEWERRDLRRPDRPDP